MYFYRGSTGGRRLTDGNAMKYILCPYKNMPVVTLHSTVVIELLELNL